MIYEVGEFYKTKAGLEIEYIGEKKLKDKEIVYMFKYEDRTLIYDKEGKRGKGYKESWNIVSEIVSEGEDDNLKYLFYIRVLSSEEVGNWYYFACTLHQSTKLLLEIEETQNYNYIRIFDKESGEIKLLSKQHIVDMTFEQTEWDVDYQDDFNDCTFSII